MPGFVQPGRFRLKPSEPGNQQSKEWQLEPVASIIVNWNGLTHLPDCLDSLAAQSFRDFEALLVDIGPEDGSVVFVEEHYPWVKEVALDKNAGFASGNNRGLKHVRGDCIVTLNNDTRGEPDWLDKHGRSKVSLSPFTIRGI